MIAEGSSETPEGEPPRQTDRDLLAERRARRAVDLDPAHPAPAHPPPAADALLRRAEAAEATVQTLETHLASLREQVREAAEERVLFVERLDGERAAVAEHEHELRLVKQREYAEQQRRVEAEDRGARLERDSRAELDSERAARERAERRLAELYESYGRVERLVAELRGVVAQLRAAAARAPASEQPTQPGGAVPSEQREQLADALAAAVERLRARAEAAPAEPEEPTDAPVAPPVRPLPPEPEPERPAAAPVSECAPHKHSMSLVKRLRIRRKQRRGR